MKDTDRDEHDEHARPPRPAWVDEQDGDPGMPPARRQRRQRAPVPGNHADDGLWEHVLVTGAIIVLAIWVAAIAIPHDVHTWMIAFFALAITGITGYTSLTLSGSGAVAGYLVIWGGYLTAWLAVARLTSPWRGMIIFALLLPAAILIPAGVTVIRRHRDRIRRGAETGRDTANVRECRYWEGFLQRLGVTGAAVKDVIRVDGGYQVHARLGKFTEGRKPTTIEAIRELAGPITQHKRLPKGAVYIEEEPAGGSSADFIIHVRSVTGPRLSRFLPAENPLLSINRAFALGVLDTGREFLLKLREVVVFICGVRGSGKSTLLNVFLAQLARTTDALIFMIDLKGGQEARAWLMPWLLEQVDRPVIHWLATTREEADVMLDALKRAGTARAESGRYGRKLRPSRDNPAIVVLCDETTVMTGHFIREDGLSNVKLATKLLQIAETFRSVAIDPVVSAVRAVVDNTGNSGLKAMSEVRIGMRVETTEEARQIFPDHLAAARQLAQLKDRGMGIPKVGPDLSPPVHFYNITDGEPDDDGHPTENLIAPIAIACAERRPEPEQLIIDAMGEAYAQRWEQPHIKQLLANWREEAGHHVPEEPAVDARRTVTADVDKPVDHPDFLKWQAELRGIDVALDDEPGYRLHPAHKRMYELLIQRGREGWKVDQLWHMLLSEGQQCARQTVHAWLKQAEEKSYVYRTGRPRSRWVWRLAEGGEFDIPGMD